MSSRGESTRILLKSNDCQREKRREERSQSQTIRRVSVNVLTKCTEHWPCLYVLYCVVWAEVQEWLHCLLSRHPSCSLCCKPSPPYMSPRCPPYRMHWGKEKFTFYFQKHELFLHHHTKTEGTCMRINGLLLIRRGGTHNDMRPSEARLNTTLPKAATPALWPWEREERVRGSRLPTRPVGERNWGEEQGPKADVLRLESMFLNRRAFTVPWGETDWRLVPKQVLCLHCAATLW